VVCQEVCPYGAISLEQAQGAKVPVPIIKAHRCFGCGYCEYHCPVFIPAITVQPLSALRLTHGQYKAEAALLGLDLMPVAERPLVPEAPEAFPAGGLPPGFTE
jgi:ferredoxin